MTRGSVKAPGRTPLTARSTAVRVTDRTRAARYPPRSYLARRVPSDSDRVRRQSLERLRTRPWLRTYVVVRMANTPSALAELKCATMRASAKFDTLDAPWSTMVRTIDALGRGRRPPRHGGVAVGQGHTK